jgi:uncharacterized membrane-anchored protein YitT (DUF2179 family)
MEIFSLILLILIVFIVGGITGIYISKYYFSKDHIFIKNGKNKIVKQVKKSIKPQNYEFTKKR